MMGVDENFEFIPMMWWARKAHAHESCVRALVAKEGSVEIVDVTS
jgi:hypothetical protein